MSKNSNPHQIFNILSFLYPNVETALTNWNGEHWKFLFAVILSAQTTDVQVNKVTKPLFEKFPTLESFAKADLSSIAEILRPIGFYNVKAKYLQNSAKVLIEKYDGIVPLKNAELEKLPGVGHKVANVVTGVLLDENEGIAVDTHVMRLSQRLGFSKHNDPVKIEKDLMKLFPVSKNWDNLSLLLIEHGRKICHARNPECRVCELNKICLASNLKDNK